MRVRLLLLLMVSSVVSTHEGMEYLQSAISDLRNMNPVTTNRRIDTLRALPSALEEKSTDEPVPPIALTKGELAELYEAAVHKGKTIKLDTGHGGIVHAAVHEIDSSHESSDHHSTADDSNGYYYYYYPLKSFVDEVMSTSNDDDVSCFYYYFFCFSF